MNREEALELLKENLQNQNLIKHSLAVEVAMQALAIEFGEDHKKWALCGLLHDIDYEIVKDKMELHSRRGAEMLKDLGFDEEIYEAVLRHNEAHGMLPESLMAKALYCIDPLTGLIVAAVLVLPSKKIADLKTENILKRLPAGPNSVKEPQQLVKSWCGNLKTSAPGTHVKVFL